MNGDERTSMDGHQWMDVCGRMLMDERGRTSERQQMSNGITMDVGRNNDGHWTKWGQMSDKTTMKQWNGTDCNYDGLHQRQHYIMICVRELYNDSVQERKEFFFLLCGFFNIIILFFFFFFQSCYKGYSLHDCKLKNTHECIIARMLTSKPVYKESKCMWGCITWCRSCTIIKPCVCVCVFPIPKAGSKTSFGVACSFFPSKLRNLELHNL
jgi:hypothetical protein